MKWNFSKMALTVFTAGMAGLTAASAANYCDPCDPCYDPCSDMFGGFQVGVDFLWWKPCMDDVDYAATVTPTLADVAPINSAIAIKKIDPSYEPGVRAWVKVEDIWCQWDFMGSYTYLQSDETGSASAASGNHVQSPHLHPAVVEQLTVPDGFVSLRAKHKIEYQSFDALLARDFDLSPCNVLTPFMGIEGVSINRRLTSELANSLQAPTSTGSYSWNGDFVGLGLKFGSQFSIAMFDGISLFGKASGTIAAGELSADSHSVTTEQSGELILTNELPHHSDDHCLLASSYHLATGLSYTTCWCDWDFSFRLGYEFLEWRNVSKIRNFYNAADGSESLSSRDSGTTLGFHGLFAGLSVGF